MPKSREHIVMNGRAAFYACIWEDLRNAAMDCGWALALHGSLKSDMDIMAMPWVEDAKPAEDMIKHLMNCFSDNSLAFAKEKPFIGKPHNRIVYSISIWADFYLDISILAGASWQSQLGSEDEQDEMYAALREDLKDLSWTALKQKYHITKKQ